jgi:drug/metabolite transporter (DMT)-like permease
MGGALLSFAAMAVAGRELSGKLSIFQMLFWRSLFGMVVVCLLLARSGWHNLGTQRFGVHLLRNCANFGGQFGWFYGIAFIPLAEVFAIEFTAPVWTSILAVFFLGEKLTWPRRIAVALGMAGVLIIVKPGSDIMHPAALAVLLGAMGYSVAHMTTKKLSSTEAPLTILFYMMLIQLPLGLLPSLTHWTTPTLAMLPMLVVIGLTGLSSHYCFTRALKLADATVVVPIDLLRLPLIAMVGALLYGESVTLSLVIGATMILSGNLFSLVMERRRGQK